MKSSEDEGFAASRMDLEAKRKQARDISLPGNLTKSADDQTRAVGEASGANVLDRVLSQEPNFQIPELIPILGKPMRQFFSDNRRESPSPSANSNKYSSNFKGDFRQFLLATNLAVSFINVGASAAWPAPLLYDIKQNGIAGDKLTVIESVVIGSLMFIAQMITPFPAGIMSDRKGRKPTLMVAGVASCVSWFLVANIDNIYMLYFARFTAGLWSGVALTIIPLYIAENARPRIRGSLGYISPTMMMFGSVLAYSLGPNVNLPTMAIACGVMPSVFLVIMLVLPESPPWLISVGKLEKARDNFEWLRGRKLADDNQLEAEFKKIISDVENDFPRWNAFTKICQTDANKRAMVVVEVLAVCQRLSGVTAILAYSVITIPDRPVGLLRPVDCLTVIGAVWLVCTIGSVIAIDKIGRIPLLILSLLGCFMCHVSSAAWFYTHKTNLKHPSVLGAHWFPFSNYMFFGASYVIGLGTVPSVLQSEMFSPRHRIVASGFTVMVHSVSSSVVNCSYLIVGERLGYHYNFGFYSLVTLAALLFTLGYVPETKGKSLRRIQEELAGHPL